VSLHSDTLSAVDTTATPSALLLSRGITATWWYTVGGILFLELVLVLVWATVALGTSGGTTGAIVVGVAGVVWVCATVPLLLDYRSASAAPRPIRWRRASVPLVIALLCGAVAGSAIGAWALAALPVTAALVLLDWGPGIRRRVVWAATLLLALLWVIDARFSVPPGDGGSGWFVGFYSALMPVLLVLSLWWWDVVVALDRARASEARLAATQERLRLATDVHDLQGHHLQVIALQLELTERLLTRDPATALDQLRAARSSVDEARQGTRDLATRFRGVPLSDELANAVDLLRAAGTAAELSAGVDVDDAPAPVFGPVIRETTTNVLRHGGGARARLSLRRDGDSWRFEISNDAEPSVPDGPGGRGGSGLEGVRRRAAEAGGSVDVHHADGTFTVVVTVPTDHEADR
jgi:two-component system sensor histidine kinase DesK